MKQKTQYLFLPLLQTSSHLQSYRLTRDIAMGQSTYQKNYWIIDDDPHQVHTNDGQQDEQNLS